jgi:hypothetical protein
MAPSAIKSCLDWAAVLSTVQPTTIRKEVSTCEKLAWRSTSLRTLPCHCSNRRMSSSASMLEGESICLSQVQGGFSLLYLSRLPLGNSLRAAGGGDGYSLQSRMGLKLNVFMPSGSQNIAVMLITETCWVNILHRPCPPICKRYSASIIHRVYGANGRIGTEVSLKGAGGETLNTKGMKRIYP